MTQWDTEQGDFGLSAFIVESFRDDQDACDADDERFVRVYAGHLIEQGWAFPSVLELLWRSFEAPWPRWEQLWGHF